MTKTNTLPTIKLTSEQGTLSTQYFETEAEARANALAAKRYGYRWVDVIDTRVDNGMRWFVVAVR